MLPGIDSQNDRSALTYLTLAPSELQQLSLPVPLDICPQLSFYTIGLCWISSHRPHPIILNLCVDAISVSDSWDVVAIPPEVARRCSKTCSRTTCQILMSLVKQLIFNPGPEGRFVGR